MELRRETPQVCGPPPPPVVILNNTGKNWKRIYADGCSDGGNIIIFVLFSKLSLTFHYCLCNNDNF